jgi:hypothetical protein
VYSLESLNNTWENEPVEMQEEGMFLMEYALFTLKWLIGKDSVHEWSLFLRETKEERLLSQLS